MLDLKRPIYRQTAAYGHMGRTDIDLPWERLDKVDALKEAVNKTKRLVETTNLFCKRNQLLAFLFYRD